MNRKVRKRQLQVREPAAPRWAGLGPLAPAAAVLGVILVTVCGMEILRHRVMSVPEYNPALSVKLEYPPGSEWVEQEGWLPRIGSCVRLPPEQRLMDENLLSGVAEQMLASGWVRGVSRITRGMDGVIRVCCDYRRPIAMLLTNHGKYIPIDQDGVRLPEEYDQVDSDSGWMRILGVQADPPQIGHAYGEGGRDDADAVAAVRLAALLFAQEEIVNRISGIDVTNFNGREDKYKTHILLWTRDHRPIKWGSAIGSEVEEPEVADKLRNLVLWLKRSSPQAYADLSV
ncbi:MAG: hypothetical protein HY718_05170 [Planctomycetes bacterium]|nr:hypothetical protein [Planctomycetota bacterium]